MVVSTDTERLDCLQKLLGSYSNKVVCRNSTTGRGWRIHETKGNDGVVDVRQAIDIYLRSCGIEIKTQYGGIKMSVENNKLIAEFMDVNISNWSNFFNDEWFDGGIKFNKSWDLLMPVVNKIWALDEYRKFVDETSGQFENKLEIDGNIDHTYSTAVEFIIWYNKHNKEKI